MVRAVKREAIEIVPYDGAWPAKFVTEASRLSAVLADWLCGPIEHIGSTAVPFLSAKPVIDMMAPVQSLDSSLTAIAAVSAAGYLYYPYKPDLMHWFCRPSPEYRTHHLHLVPLDSPLWHQRIAFRDALRQNPSLATEYAELKIGLAQTLGHDRDAYSEAKTPFINRVLSELGMCGGI